MREIEDGYQHGLKRNVGPEAMHNRHHCNSIPKGWKVNILRSEERGPQKCCLRTTRQVQVSCCSTKAALRGC